MSLKNFTEKIDKVSCEKGATVQEAAELMKKNSVGTVLIEDKGSPVGMLSDRDIVVRCLAESKSPEDTKVESIMSYPVSTVRDSASILDLVEKMGSDGVRRMCITNDKNEAIGVVSEGDVFELLSHEISVLAKASQERSEKLFRRAATH